MNINVEGNIRFYRNQHSKVYNNQYPKLLILLTKCESSIEVDSVLSSSSEAKFFSKKLI